MIIIRDKGFTLMEVLLSFSILVFLVMTTLPLFLKVQAERMAIRQQYEAIQYAEKGIHSYLVQTPLSSPPSTFEETIHNDDSRGYVMYCLAWEAMNKRPYEYCLYAK